MPRLTLGKVVSIRQADRANPTGDSQFAARIRDAVGHSPMASFALGIGVLHSTTSSRQRLVYWESDQSQTGGGLGARQSAGSDDKSTSPMT